MKIKRYFARDMRQAIRMVREEQGPDAVILSNRSVEGGVEIVAAVDYDESVFWQSAPVPAAAPAVSEATKPGGGQARSNREGSFANRKTPEPPVEWTQEPALQALRDEIQSVREMLQQQLSALAWGELGRRKPQRAALFRRLIQLDLSPGLARRVAAEAGDSGDAEGLWRKALAILAHRLRVIDEGPLNNGGVVALVGPTGVGKTTTVAKLAARYALAHGGEQVGLITTDGYRVGAVEQLKTFGRIMGVPVRVTKGAEALRSAMEELYDRRLVLIDTAGMGQRDVRLPDQLAQLSDGLPMVQSYLVMSATSQLPGLIETVHAFRGAGLEGCILTKLDEAGGLGQLISALILKQLPIAYVCDGQRVPEDVHPAKAHNLVARAVSQMQRALNEVPGEMVELAYGGVGGNGVL